VAHDQAAAPVAQAGVELAEALEQELGARSGGVPAAQQSIVEAEDRDHRAGGVQSGAEPRMIVQPQVAPKPHQGGHGWDLTSR
jgi:hypothetical protein